MPAGEFLPIALPDGTDLFIQQYAYLLKHHHLLANVDGKTFWRGATKVGDDDTGNKDFHLRATQKISVGDELYLPFSSHPRKQLGATSTLFKDIPSEDDFDLAESIIRDTIVSFPTMKGRITISTKEIGKLVCFL
jgi:hypothetical protein